MNYEILYTRQAEKDYQKIKKLPALLTNVKKLINVLKAEPRTPPYEKLTGLQNTYSKRVNIQRRLIYEVFDEQKIVKVIRMWSHYEN
jgi:Txe/YoeB family toxin of toxin-antitoxin system